MLVKYQKYPLYFFTQWSRHRESMKSWKHTDQPFVDVTTQIPVTDTTNTWCWSYNPCKDSGTDNLNKLQHEELLKAKYESFRILLRTRTEVIVFGCPFSGLNYGHVNSLYCVYDYKLDWFSGYLIMLACYNHECICNAKMYDQDSLELGSLIFSWIQLLAWLSSVLKVELFFDVNR